MALFKKNIWILLLLILVGALLGNVLGEILRAISPEGPVRNIFTEGFHIGITPPVTLDLRIITFTIGFSIRANLLTLLGSILGIYIYKYV
ncbi:MAG: hypothetical protein A2132_02955 [Nitrospirae bacterium RBG_16_43_11]|nr:MAG: hypothetical protein A2132_02955 [Nitrospirae bacterium RBG_16_43_11]